VVAGAGLTVDDRRNEREICQDMLEDAAPLDDLFTSLMREMKGRGFDESQDLIDALGSVQVIVTCAMWKHHLTVNRRLEHFARDFDRLDVNDERRRLYDLAQAPTIESNATRNRATP
jgi:hypothetical protein